jgi:predicted unusual protein kinase regulating ubiquinone biosynthesis (AarF/ABC1/UbiB family)
MYRTKVIPRAAPTCNVPNSPWRIVRFLGETQLRYHGMRVEDRQKHYGTWLREEMTELGPAFIKLGQFLSTRSDLFDKHITQELARLQDDITPLPFEELVHIFDEFLPTWKDIFSTIDPVPIACASIGQVHIGTLRENGQKVVLKVQKPCVARSIRNDLATLEQINSWLKHLQSPRASEVESLLVQYERFLASELDYTRELHNMEVFMKTLDGLPVKVPKPYSNMSSSQLLVMEYVPSIKISDLPKLDQFMIDRSYVATSLIEVFLHMMVHDGFVHCDPHPGNLGVMEDGETLVLYDYGNVVQLGQDFRSEIRHLIFSIYQRDVDEFVDLIVSLKIVQVESEEDILDLRSFFGSFFKYLETMDFANLKSSILTSDYPANFAKNIKIHPDFLSLFRVFSLLDGTCSKLDPNFNYITAITPFSEEMMGDIRFFDYRARKDLQKLQTYPNRVQTTDQNVLRVQRQIRELSTTISQLRIAIAIISAFSLFVQLF